MITYKKILENTVNNISKKYFYNNENFTIQTIIRKLIKDEIDAVDSYQMAAKYISDEKIRNIILDIADEEKVHIQELNTLLTFIDPEYKDAITSGTREVIEKYK